MERNFTYSKTGETTKIRLGYTLQIGRDTSNQLFFKTVKDWSVCYDIFFGNRLYNHSSVYVTFFLFFGINFIIIFFAYIQIEIWRRYQHNKYKTYVVVCVGMKHLMDFFVSNSKVNIDENIQFGYTSNVEMCIFEIFLDA